MRRALRRFFNLCLFIFNRRFFMVLLRRMGCVKMVVCGVAVASRGTAVNADDVRHGDAQRVFVKSTEKEDELTASGWLSFTAADEATTLPARRLMVVIRETNDRSILTSRLLEKDHSHTKTTKREAAQGSLVRSRQCLYVIKSFCWMARSGGDDRRSRRRSTTLRRRGRRCRRRQRRRRRRCEEKMERRHGGTAATDTYAMYYTSFMKKSVQVAFHNLRTRDHSTTTTRHSGHCRRFILR